MVFAEPLLIPSEMVAALAVEEAAPQFLLPGEGMLVHADPSFFSWMSHRKEVLNLDKLEAQLKACNCRLVFSKAKVSRSSCL